MTQKLILRPADNDVRDFEVVLYEIDPICVGPTTYFSQLAFDTGDDGWGFMLTIWADVNHVVVSAQTVINLEEKGLDLTGVRVGEVPSDESLEALAQIINRCISEMSYDAHVHLREKITEAEKVLKELREAHDMLSHIELQAENQGRNQTLRVSLAMAARVIASGQDGEVKRAKQVHPPFRMQKVARNQLVCYDDANRPIARIGFDPTRSGPIWMGLYLIQGRTGVL